MDRPDKLNALGPSFWDGIGPLFAEIDADADARCVVLDGAGRAFTSGLDVMGMVPSLPLDLQGGPPDGARRHALHEVIRRLQAAITAVERCRVPVIAAVHGFCLGGGVDLATACDIRWAASDAVFGVRETKLAMVADVGTLQRLPAIVGTAWARELAFTGRDFDAALAERIGLVTRVLPDKAGLDEAVMALADEIAGNPPLAVQGCKRVLLEADRGRIDRGLEYVATWNAGYLATRDLSAAMTAMATRTRPTFEGR